jgi:hypothetical protein
LNNLVQRKSKKTNRLTQPEKLMVVVLADRLRAREGRPVRDRLRACLVLANPNTVLQSHRELVCMLLAGLRVVIVRRLVSAESPTPGWPLL